MALWNINKRAVGLTLDVYCEQLDVLDLEVWRILRNKNYRSSSFMPVRYSLYNYNIRSWEDGPVVRSTCRSWGRPGFSPSTHMVASQPSITPVPGDPMPLLTFIDMYVCYRENIHIEI